MIERIANNPLNATQLLIAELRRVADQNVTVGNRCMVIDLPSPQFGWPRITYDSPDRDTANLVSKDKIQRFSAAFTPWIIGENLVQAPSIHSGGDTMLQFGSWQVEITGTTGIHDSGSILGVHSSQRRWPRP